MPMKKLISILILSAFFSLSSFGECSLESNKKTPLVGFTAFKTPAKVGVNGTFKKVNWTGPKTGNSLEELLKGQSFVIDTGSLDTKNEGRDQNIIENFFSLLKGKSSISGKVTKVSKKQVTLEISLNGKKRLIPLKYSFENSVFNGSGHIDLLDFSASEALKSINKACFALHEGKTWSHVEINVTHTLPSCKK